MSKKYAIISLFLFILFIIIRVYIYSEHVKISYAQQRIHNEIEQQEKKQLQLVAHLHELQSSPFIKKDAQEILNFIPLTLTQIFSLSKDESIT